MGSIVNENNYKIYIYINDSKEDYTDGLPTIDNLKVKEDNNERKRSD